MMRLAITRDEDGAIDVPVPRRVRGSGEGSSSLEILRLKKSAGTDPHVMGATKVAIVD